MPREEKAKALATTEEQRKKNTLSRLQQYEEDGIDPKMPPLPVPQMATWLMEIGPTEAAGMGAGPISWQSIAAWKLDVACVPISPWEGRTLRRMSKAYVIMAEEARAIDCPSPWAQQLNEANREAIGRKISAIFGSRARGD